MENLVAFEKFIDQRVIPTRNMVPYSKFIINENSEKIEYSDEDKESVTIAKDHLNKIKEDVNEFNSKKGKLEQMIMDNKGEDKKDISDKVESLVEDNKFLKMYVSIVNKKRKLQDLQDKIDYFEKLMSERKSDLQATRNLSNKEDRENQRERLEDQIENIEENVSEIEGQIKDLENQIKDDEDKMEEHIKNAEEKFKQNIKNTEWDVDLEND